MYEQKKHLLYETLTKKEKRAIDIYIETIINPIIKKEQLLIQAKYLNK